MKEIGRSMVEMLGVLAVIGILSVGSISGYTTAINKHHANEIVNDVNLRAHMLAPQIVSNGSISNTSDLGTENKLGNTITVTPAANSFVINVADVPAGVCRDIVRSDWQDTPVLAVTVNETTYTGVSDICGSDKVALGFTFANNLEQTIQAVNDTENPDDTKECETDTECANTPDRPRCVQNKCTDGCSTNDHCTEAKPICDTTTAQCVECVQNSQCESTEYCGGTNHSCTTPQYNTCEPMDIYHYQFTFNGYTYISSNNTMSWWDATRFCERLGKSLIPAGELNGNANGTVTSADADYSKSLRIQLNKYSRTVWTATPLKNDCHAYAVDLVTGTLESGNRSGSGKYYPMCR